MPDNPLCHVHANRVLLRDYEAKIALQPLEEMRSTAETAANIDSEVRAAFGLGAERAALKEL
jgi:hypothetical protein